MPQEREVTEPAEVLRASYGAFAAVVRSITDERSWLPTGCVGWSVRDLVFHCLSDAQRGLVALHTPAEGMPDRDAVTYWADWRPGTVGAANGRRYNRVVASMFLHVEQLCELYAETAAAVVYGRRRDRPAGRDPGPRPARRGPDPHAGRRGDDPPSRSRRVPPRRTRALDRRAR
ncbi:maleylpyruvate isomerase N-terminal domain-containing protein [Streptomyces sp. NPDC091259]|uniref:maleylpyruvate isomerase N-terminal domain-containing protein n=1 Tax=Streptomyces sp. NPDC091259 TaxID=3365976 RepID=UPI0037FD83B1